MKFFNLLGFYSSSITNLLIKKRGFLGFVGMLVFFTGSLFVSVKAQSAGQNTKKCQSSFTGLSKELKNLLTQNRDTKSLPDIVKAMDSLIENKKANPNEAFMWASLREETALLTHLMENYNLDPSAVIDYAFKKGISKKEVDNLIYWEPKYKPFEVSLFLIEVFIRASVNKNLEISTHLIQKWGVNVNDVFLHIAQRGDIETATYLIENHGADIDYIPDNMIHYANFTQVHLRKLLKVTHDLHPLIVASAYGQRDFVKYLLQKDSFDEIIIENAFLKAVEVGHKETVKVFIELKALEDLEYALIVALSTTISTPKTRASQAFAHFLIEETIKWLDKKPVQQTDSLLMFSLALAASKNLKSKVQLLIQKGVAVFEVHYAVKSALKNNNIDLALYLLNHIKNSDLRDNSHLIKDSHLGSVTHIYFYSKHNRKKIKQIIDLLIEIEKPDPEERVNGKFHIMTVAQVGEAQHIELLIERGHDIHVKDNKGENVADYALRNQDTGPLQILYKKGAKITKDYFADDFFKNFKLKIEHVKILIQGGFNINTRIGKKQLFYM